ncbi:hypothetical protein D3C83_320450 [compost metagenome]
MLSTKNRMSRPSSRKYSAMVRPVSATRRRLPGGSFIWPYTIATLELVRSFLSMTPDSIISW